MTTFLPALAVSLLPVLCFLLILVWLDSYKLVRISPLVITIAAGAAAAGLSWLINSGLLRAGVPVELLSRLAAPIVEEPLKAVALIALLRSNRIGFHVDATIFGFAAGTGFALVENTYYLHTLGDAGPATWIIRGFGTALMHGGSSAIFAIVAKTLGERRGGIDAASWLLAFLPAIVVHGFFNQFFLTPLFSALTVLVLLPPLLLAVFQRSERAVREWLGTGFDEDVALLEQLLTGEFSESRPGRYLQSIREHFPGEVLADMLCYLRLHLELSIRAKGELMLRENGFKGEIGPETRAKFEELRFLERSIGPTGRRALAPCLRGDDRDLWQLDLLSRT